MPLRGSRVVIIEYATSVIIPHQIGRPVLEIAFESSCEAMTQVLGVYGDSSGAA